MRYDRSLVPSSPSHLILFPSLPTVAPLREWHESEDAKHRNEHGSDESGGTRVTHCHFGSVSTGLSPVTLRYLLIIPVGDPVSPRPSFISRLVPSPVFHSGTLLLAWRLSPKSRKERGMLDLPWLAVELREWFASTRSTFLWFTSPIP